MTTARDRFWRLPPPPDSEVREVRDSPEAEKPLLVGEEERAAYRRYMRDYMREYRKRKKEES